MGLESRDCIVTFIDLPGVKKLAPRHGAGSNLMRQLHRLAGGGSTAAVDRGPCSRLE